MLNSMFRRVGLGLLPLVLAACASQPSVEVEKPAVARQYTQAYITQVTTAIVNDDQPDEQRLAAKKELDEKLPSILREALEEEGFAVPAGSPEAKPGVVWVRLSMQYNPGNRALRWLAGPFGAGKGHVEGKIEALDAVTGSVIATESDSDSVRMGAFGGNFYGEVEDLAESLAGDLADALNNQSQ